MSPAELPKGSVPGAFFRKVGKPEFAKATPAARYLSWLLLGVGDTSEQALAACGPRFGARDPCAGRSPPGARAIRARAAHRRGRAQSVRGLLTAGRFACPAGYSGLSGAIAPGADKPRLRPSARLTRGGSSDPSPYVIPTSAWRDRMGRTPVRPEGDRLTEPALELECLQEARQPHGVCHASCWGQAVRLNGCLAACGPHFLGGLRPGDKGAALENGQDL